MFHRFGECPSHCNSRPRNETAMMATSRCILLFIVTCAFFALANGNFTMRTGALRRDTDIICLDECEFVEDSQTITIINISLPRQAVKGVAYYSKPIRMKDPETRTVASFSTSFTFREEPMNYNATATPEDRDSFKRGDGFAFMFSNSSSWKSEAAGRLGIFSINKEDNSKVVAVEFDSWSSNDTDLGLKQEEHVGLDVASAISVPDCIAYVTPLGISFWHRDVLYSWIEFDGTTSMLQVRVANTSSRPDLPLLSCSYPQMYDAFDEVMYIGFSGAHGDNWSVYYIYNWTFTSFGISPDILFGNSSVNLALILGASGGGLLALLFVVVGICLYLRRKRAQDQNWENEEMLEMAGMPEFISYKHLSAATKQFSDQSKLGEGGFGSVYRGVLPKTGANVAVKKVSNDSKQGEREFLAEVQIISQLRHRNIVELMGFCRDRGKFLLVYELLPRGSLDKALFKPNTPQDVLSWSQRWKIVSGTASALHYLHEGWRQQVIHRDVKSSNIMLDDEYNAKLGDFGLARLVDHEKNAATTLVAGTYGYLAPEAAGGKFTEKTDVFAFGAVALEVACGRTALDRTVKNVDDLILLDKVWRLLKEGDILGAADHRLQGEYDADQMHTVLKLGLLCSHPDPSSRPSMRQVVQVLSGDADVPEVPHFQPKASLASDLPHISIDDLMSSRSGTHSSKSGEKRPVSSYSSHSMPSSSSVPVSTVNSASFVTQLYPR